MSYLIRNFGNNKICKDADSLVATLREQYAGGSVTVLSSAETGIKRVTYVDVPSSPDLPILDSYTCEPVSFE